VPEDHYPMRRAGGQAVVRLPEHIGAANAGQIREILLSVINRGAQVLIADMAATISCDHTGADAVIRAWQRAAVSGTELRLVVTAKTVSQVLDQRGLDRLVSVYPSLEAAMAARTPDAVAGVAWSRRPRQPQAAFGAAAAPNGKGASAAPVSELLEALQDAVMLADGGMIAAASTRMEDMFGYGPDELPGLSAESLVPGGLQEAHRGCQEAWAMVPRSRPTGASGPLAGLRKNGTTFPVQVSLTPVTTAAGPLTLAVIRDITRTTRLEDLNGLARDAAPAQQEHLQLMDTVITGLFHAGLSLQTAMNSLPAGPGRQRVEEAACDLDDIIRRIRDTAFTVRDRPASSRSAPPGDGR
jgi:anti-anti-sigma factor